MADAFSFANGVGPIRETTVSGGPEGPFSTSMRLMDGAVWLDRTKTGDAAQKDGWFTWDKAKGDWSKAEDGLQIPFGKKVKVGDGETWQRDGDGAMFLHPKFFGKNCSQVMGEAGWYVNQNGRYVQANDQQGMAHSALGVIRAVSKNHASMARSLLTVSKRPSKEQQLAERKIADYQAALLDIQMYGRLDEIFTVIGERPKYGFHPESGGTIVALSPDAQSAFDRWDLAKQGFSEAQRLLVNLESERSSPPTMLWNLVFPTFLLMLVSLVVGIFARWIKDRSCITRQQS